jgi:hypothetical protein
MERPFTYGMGRVFHLVRRLSAQRVRGGRKGIGGRVELARGARAARDAVVERCVGNGGRWVVAGSPGADGRSCRQCAGVRSARDILREERQYGRVGDADGDRGADQDGGEAVHVEPSLRCCVLPKVAVCRWYTKRAFRALWLRIRNSIVALVSVTARSGTVRVGSATRRGARSRARYRMWLRRAWLCGCAAVRAQEVVRAWREVGRGLRAVQGAVCSGRTAAEAGRGAWRADFLQVIESK